MFKSLLIANRGEIACRVARTAQRLGMRTVAVYSDADAGALHTRIADAALRIGPPAARESYLDIEAVIRAALESEAEAVHPGYGFLSQSAEFAEACARAGLAFVGPPPHAIRAMGVKDEAKSLMQRAGVPIVPGYLGERQEDAHLAAMADSLGYPLLIKAVAGGGGKGMRIVRAPADFNAALAAARGEAQRAFGDGRVMLERYLERARHVEVQIIADRHGTCLHLLERDCSLQRRYQKIIEEAPAPGLSHALRTRLHCAAVDAARAVGYQNAGTVEFVVDREECFFLEMNTRLQVEHPVTEATLGIDLVEWQLRVAAGEPLPLPQEAVRARGHAFEARIYAEDPRRGFLPAGGRLRELIWPRGAVLDARSAGPVRVDSAVETADRVVTDYDALLAKLIVHAQSREAALQCLTDALIACRIEGVTTNLAALIALSTDRQVRAARLSTRLIDERGDALLPALAFQRERAALLGALALLAPPREPPIVSAWNARDGWSMQGSRGARVWLQDVDGRTWAIDARASDPGWDASVGERQYVLGRYECSQGSTGGLVGCAELDGQCIDWFARTERDQVSVWLHGEWHRFDRVSSAVDAAADVSEGIVRAPMPGAVLTVLVREHEQVRRGQALIVLEAMKMEHTLTAGAAGRVAELRAVAGERVREGDPLLRIIAPAG